MRLNTFVKNYPMKKYALIFFAVLFFTACKDEKKDIEFKKIANIDLGNLSKGSAKLRGTVVFMNLSDEEYSLKDLVLDFTIDGKDVGTVVTKMTKKIQPNSEFSVPIEYSYDTKSIKEEGHDPASTYAVELLGDLTVKDTKDKEISTAVKYATTYEYLTKKEIRIEKREERKKRRQERKANKNN